MERLHTPLSHRGGLLFVIVRSLTLAHTHTHKSTCCTFTLWDTRGMKPLKTTGVIHTLCPNCRFLSTLKQLLKINFVFDFILNASLTGSSVNSRGRPRLAQGKGTFKESWFLDLPPHHAKNRNSVGKKEYGLRQ